MRESCSTTDQIVYTIFSVQKEITRRFDSELDGLSLTRYDILSNLHHIGPLSQRELQQRVDVDHAAITRHLKQLELQQLVVRKRCDLDSRVLYVDLTPLGHDRIVQLLTRKRELSERCFDTFTLTEQQALRDLLEKLQTNMHQEKESTL